jgi:thiosulfate/3-mercaptopyruvate sulfurtransferase
VPTQKKFWVYNGLIEQYSDNYLKTTHGSQACTTCHGGDVNASTRGLAHTGTWLAIPGSDKCSGCHAAIVASSDNSLHTTLGGYVKTLGDRGFDFGGATQAQRFGEQCTKCHVANSSGKGACGFCHVSVPTTAGGGFLNGHNFRFTPDMERNCTACHGSRVKDEFFGLNNALITRNGLGMGSVEPDVHFARTKMIDNATGLPKGCAFCHSGSEMHGAGAPSPVGSGARYDVTGTPKCTDCHTVTGTNNLHSSGHLATMDCQVCHAQPYKNCFGCHTDIDVGNTGLPFYKINEGDPTLAVRPEGSAPDALMSFRIGKNPLWLGTGDTGNKKYAVLRHSPVDKDVFRYPLAAPIDNLLPNVTALSTWRYATPHNIQRNLLGTTGSFASFDVGNCNNCHGAAYADHWLTNPVADSEGWLQPAYQADDNTANANVIQPTAPPMLATP